MVFRIDENQIANELKRVWLVPFKCRPIFVPFHFLVNAPAALRCALIEVVGSSILYIFCILYQMLFCSIITYIEWRLARY